MSNTFLYLLTVLVWGSTWLAIDFQLGVVPPEVSVVWRYVLAAGLLISWIAIRRGRLRFGLHAHIRFLGLGLLLFSFNYIATYSAQQYISSALNAVVFSGMMWMNVLNARLFLGTRSSRRTWLGAAMGSLGIVLLFWPQLRDLEWGSAALVGAGFSLGGAMLASLGNILSKRAQEEGLPVVPSNAWGMLYGALISAVYAWRGGLEFTIDTSASYLISLLYLAVFGTIVAFGAYLTLMGRIGPHRAGYVVVMFPVVAVALAVLFQGFELDAWVVAGMGLVLGGNVVVLGFRQKGREFRAWINAWKREWLQNKAVVNGECQEPPAGA